METYEVKISYSAIADNGKSKTVKETYFIEAQIFGEAEEIMHKYAEQNISADITIQAMAKRKIASIFEYEEGEWWNTVSVKYVILDEETGKEKSVTDIYLVNADTIEGAVTRVSEQLGDAIPFTITKFEQRPEVVAPLVYNPETIKR